MNFSIWNTSKSRLWLVALAALAAFSIAVAADARAGDSGGLGTKATSNDAHSKPAGKSKYDRIWNRTSKRQKRWATRTSACESGGDPKAIGGGGRYRGAFQFMKATWRASPKSPGGDPIRYNYRTQAVVAVALKKRDGRGHWPSCG